MGTISRFDIRQIKKEFGLTHFVETGTWYGDGVNHALGAGFKVASCEINEDTYAIAQKRFKDRTEDVALFNMDSESFLLWAEPFREKFKPETLYFLDAHLPQYYVPVEESERFSQNFILPLEKELHILKDLPGIEKSVIVIDDLRIYIKGANYESGEVPEINTDFDLLRFINQHFMKSHDTYFLRNDEGYAILFPKTNNEEWPRIYPKEKHI